MNRLDLQEKPQKSEPKDIPVETFLIKFLEELVLERTLQENDKR